MCVCGRVCVSVFLCLVWLATKSTGTNKMCQPSPARDTCHMNPAGRIESAASMLDEFLFGRVLNKNWFSSMVYGDWVKIFIFFTWRVLDKNLSSSITTKMLPVVGLPSHSHGCAILPLEAYFTCSVFTTYTSRFGVKIALSSSIWNLKSFASFIKKSAEPSCVPRILSCPSCFKRFRM